LARRCGALVVAGLSLAGAARAQAPGTVGGVLLEVPATARAMALGGAYAAVMGDAGAVFVNPAGLAPIKRLAVSASYERYLLDSQFAGASIATRVGKFDLGFGLHVLDFGSDSAFVPDPAFGGDRGRATGATIGAYHALAVGALAYRRGMLSAGVSVKALREHVGYAADSAANVSAVGGTSGSRPPSSTSPRSPSWCRTSAATCAAAPWRGRRSRGRPGSASR
jgi:hypothetical protein